jgi:hypothetical protein
MEMKALIAAAATVLVAALAGGVVAWAFYWDYRKKQLQHEERRLMIEKGMTPPPIFSGNWPQVKQHEQQLRYEERRLRIEKGLDVPLDEKKPLTPDDFLRRGTIMLFLGVGLGLAYVIGHRSGLRVYGDEEAWLFALAVSGAVIGLAGLGHLVYYRLAKAPGPPESGRAV